MFFDWMFLIEGSIRGITMVDKIKSEPVGRWYMRERSRAGVDLGFFFTELANQLIANNFP